ncbi:hypothetical protein RJ639_036361 [Escallonia herrerae]|uniref:Response regulatory domain-containing protein n=1 Tax=Escallonia herrerae TaxID=1293975 RepID=A0AA89BC07_9ASTE|nr:hypothetical protein RJ639_036361 [Escallonia herrerae]
MDMDSTEIDVVPSLARGLRVLLVEHDIASLKSIASVLEEHSYKGGVAVTFLGQKKQPCRLKLKIARESNYSPITCDYLSVTTTELASVALSMIRERGDEFDVVIIEVNMPGMDGFLFLKQIQLMRDMPIICELQIMGWGLNLELARKAIEEGACFFLHKPIRVRTLINVWQHVFRERRLMMEAAKKKNAKERGDWGTKIQHLLSDGDRQTKQIGGGVATVEKDNAREPKRSSTHDQQRLVAEKNGKQGEFTKRKEVDDEDGKRKRTRSVPKSRVTWTPALHQKFMEAISRLGDKKPHPKRLLRMMNVPFLTHRHVASHLQKYRERIKNINYDSGYGYQEAMEELTGSSRPWLNHGTSVHYSLETLEKRLQSAEFFNRKPPDTKALGTNTGNGVHKVPDTENDRACWDANANGKQPIGIEGCNLNFANVQQQLNPTPNQFQYVHQQPNPTINQFQNVHQQLNPTPNHTTSALQQLNPTPNQFPDQHQQLNPTPNQFSDVHQQLNPTASQFPDVLQQLNSTPNLPDVHQQLTPTPNQFPMTFPAITEELGQAHSGSSSLANPNEFSEGFHGVNQESNAILGLDAAACFHNEDDSQIDYAELMELLQEQEFEDDFHGDKQDSNATPGLDAAACFLNEDENQIDYGELMGLLQEPESEEQICIRRDQDTGKEKSTDMVATQRTAIQPTRIPQRPKLKGPGMNDFRAKVNLKNMGSA